MNGGLAGQFTVSSSLQHPGPGQNLDPSPWPELLAEGLVVPVGALVHVKLRDLVTGKPSALCLLTKANLSLVAAPERSVEHRAHGPPALPREHGTLCEPSAPI